MKKYTLLFPLILFLSGCAATSGGFVNPRFEEKRLDRVAVVKFVGPEDLCATITDKFTTELFKLNYFEVYERHQVDKILQEQGFSLTGVTEDNVRAALGKIANLDALFIGAVSSYPGAFGTTDVSLTVKLVDIESGGLIYSCDAKSDHAIAAWGTLGEAMSIVVGAIIKDIRKQLGRSVSFKSSRKSDLEQVIEIEESTQLPNFRATFPEFNHYSDEQILKTYRAKFLQLREKNNDELIRLIEAKYRKKK